MDRRIWGCAFLLLAVLGLSYLLQPAARSQDAVSDPGAATGVEKIALPAREPARLELVAKLGSGPGKENSGIVKSRRQNDLFWIHNDSGDEPRIYAVHADGSDYPGSRNAPMPGVLIGGGMNVDWEDITVDDQGHVIVGDVGNNDNDRRDLVLYYLFEPVPKAGRTTLLKKIFVHYPEQKQFPAPADDFNYDCEAIFTVDNVVHLITKHRSDTRGRLYRLDKPRLNISNPLKLVDTFDFQGKVVGADATADGLRLIVITYESLWLFERTDKTQPFFAGRVSWAPFKSEQVEAVCFKDDQTLLLGDEQRGELFTVALSKLQPVREPQPARPVAGKNTQ